MRPITIALLSFGLAALTACSRIDPIGTDLVALNAAGQTAMAQADVQQAMAKVQAAATNPEKAAIMRESAAAIGRARDTLEKTEMKSPEVRDIRARMVAGFGKLGAGAKTAADAFETSTTADLDKARQQMREGQVEFINAGQDMVTLAKRRSVDLNTRRS
jgi:hypothetical protein